LIFITYLKGSSIVGPVGRTPNTTLPETQKIDYIYKVKQQVHIHMWGGHY